MDGTSYYNQSMHKGFDDVQPIYLRYYNNNNITVVTCEMTVLLICLTCVTFGLWSSGFGHTYANFS